MKLSALLFFLCSILLPTFYCDHILVFLPLPIWSHQMQYQAVWSELAERGHTIDYFGAFPPKNNTNIKHFPLKLTNFEERMEQWDPSQVPDGKLIEIFSSIFLWNFGMSGLTEAYESKEFIQLMTSNSKYDLVITESFFAMESSVALGHRFNAPVISVCSFGIADNSLEAFGSPNLPSYMPDYRTKYTDKMSFFERFHNFYVVVITKLMEYFWYYPKQQALIDKHFGTDYPKLDTLLSNMSLTLLYATKVMSVPVPLVPNMIIVGGIHLKKPGKLPKDVQKLTDSSKSGFIYMSFGSVVNPSKLNVKVKQSFLNTFKKIKLPIFWKIDINLETDPIINKTTLPSNVVIKKWFPQNDMLAHPNIRLFITHGGISSTMESSSAGVPTLGVPFFGDQYFNTKLASLRGYGLVETFLNFNEDTFVEKINTILNDPKFKQNALKWSKIANDHLASPLDTAIYWIEYVLRHKGAPHLSVASRYMSWYQVYSLDVIGLTLAIGYSFYKLMYLACCSRRPKKTNASVEKKKK